MSKENLSSYQVPRKIAEIFPQGTIDIVKRIEQNNEVLGLLHIQNDSVKFNTLHNVNLASNIPAFTAAVQRAVSEIKLLTHALVFIKMKLLKKLLKRSEDDRLYEITEQVNKVNPIIDRIIADDSVDGVVMTNEEGTPILTNMIAAQAAGYGKSMKRLGIMANYAVKEIDTFDEVLVFRINTRKREIMSVTNDIFNIIVVQRQGVVERKKQDMTNRQIKEKKKKKSQ